MEKKFKTTDICLCAALACNGFYAEEIDKSTPTKSEFIYNNSIGLRQLINEFFTHTLKVDPIKFFHGLSELKTRIYHS